VEVDSGNRAYVNIIDDLSLNKDISVPAGVTLVVKNGKKLTVDSGSTLDLRGGGLILEDNTTFTVDGTVNAKGSSGPTSFGIGLMPGQTNTTINGSGTIHLKTQGVLLGIMADQKLILSGTVTLDGLRTPADGGSDTNDTENNVSHVVSVRGELDMRGGKITGNYHTADYDGGGVEVNGGTATFTMSGYAEVSGNRTAKGGAGVSVVHGGTFVMKDNAKISDNIADGGGGGVRVNQGIYSTTRFTMWDNAEISDNTAGTYGGGVWVRDGGSFILNGGTVTSNTASSGGPSLYVDSSYAHIGTAKWGPSGGSPGGTANGNILGGAGTGGAGGTLSAP
jgi:hypothetical protein